MGRCSSKTIAGWAAGSEEKTTRKISARSRELLLPRGLWSKAKLELEGRRDERVELEETDELCQGVTALTLGRQMQVVQGGCREWERHCALEQRFAGQKSHKMHIFLHSCKQKLAKRG